MSSDGFVVRGVCVGGKRNEVRSSTGPSLIFHDYFPLPMNPCFASALTLKQRFAAPRNPAFFSNGGISNPRLWTTDRSEESHSRRPLSPFNQDPLDEGTILTSFPNVGRSVSVKEPYERTLPQSWKTAGETRKDHGDQPMLARRINAAEHLTSLLRVASLFSGRRTPYTYEYLSMRRHCYLNTLTHYCICPASS